MDAFYILNVEPLADIDSHNEALNRTAEPPCSTARPQRQRGWTDEHGGEEEQGAPPTNRAPDNYIQPKFHPLRYGVDSLYLSFPGILAPDWEEKLRKLKILAQSESEHESALAQVVIASHLFEIKDKGKGRFAFVLVDNCFHIQVSTGQSLPLAYVQISSEYLAHVGEAKAEEALRYIVNTLGVVKEPANISRVDLFVDFVTDVELDKIDERHWITRSHGLDKHWRHGRFSGWSIGLGGDISARLYDKTLEIEKVSKKYYLHELWKQNAWNGENVVWRMEFQAKREPLKQLGITKFADLEKHQASLWQYLSQDWLRWAVPQETDSNQTRWPNHPLWDAISGVYFRDLDQPRLKRFNPARIPSDKKLFVDGLWPLTSFMAREGITDLGEGVGEFLANVEAHHWIPGHDKSHGLRRYVNQKVKAKGRRYNSIDNRKDNAQARHETAQAAETYQRMKDGEDENP